MALTEFDNYTERIFSAYHYYSLSKKLNNTYRLDIELNAEILSQTLKDAVKQTMLRYPYLSIKRRNTFSETLLVHNAAEVVVKHSSKTIPLGCADSNYHLIALSYNENHIYINGFHGLMDGVGVFNLANTLLHYYCKMAFDPDLSGDGVRLVGDEIPPEEYVDPFPRTVPKEYKALVKRPLLSKAYHLKDDKRVHYGQKHRCTIKIDENELMKFCRINDGSPAALTAVLMSRCIARLNPDRRKPVIAGIALNLRPAFNAPLAHHSLTDIIPVEFTEKLKKCSFDMQNTAFRSQIFIKSDNETVTKNLEFASKTFQLMQKIPSLALKRLIYGISVPSQYCANTFMLSYIGKADFGAAQKYVEQIRIDLDTPDIGIAIELSAIHGFFYVDIMCDFPEELYIDGFCKELEEVGIPYERGECFPLETPKCTY